MAGDKSPIPPTRLDLASLRSAKYVYRKHTHACAAMLVILLQFSIILLAIAIYPLQLYRSYNRYMGVDTAQAVVSDWLFPLLIAQSVLWYMYALESSEWFILFNSTTNILCQGCILYCIKHTSPTIIEVNQTVNVPDTPLVRGHDHHHNNGTAERHRVPHVYASVHPHAHTPVHSHSHSHSYNAAGKLAYPTQTYTPVCQDPHAWPAYVGGAVGLY